jgi:hypothetical protein
LELLGFCLRGIEILRGAQMPNRIAVPFTIRSKGSEAHGMRFLANRGLVGRGTALD